MRREVRQIPDCYCLGVATNRTLIKRVCSIVLFCSTNFMIKGTCHDTSAIGIHSAWPHEDVKVKSLDECIEVRLCLIFWYRNLRLHSHLVLSYDCFVGRAGDQEILTDFVVSGKGGKVVDADYLIITTGRTLAEEIGATGHIWISKVVINIVDFLNG